MNRKDKMKKLFAVLFVPSLLCACSSFPDGDGMIDTYVSEFNADDEELYVQKFPDSGAAEFMKANIPVFECPDKELEKTYYFRWWTFRKHIKETPAGFVISEFLPDVGWAGKYNTINCAASHHFAEGRWLRDGSYLNDYMRFWCSPDGSPRRYSFPISDALLKFCSVHPDDDLLKALYPRLKEIYAEWESDHRDANGLFWQLDGYDGMEVSVSGSLCPDARGYRATINSYMYADAVALSWMADKFGNETEASLYKAKADTIKGLMDTYLWDEESRFYKVIPRNGEMTLSPAREEHGYVPWMYDIPGKDKSDAWLQLMDPQGFKAPFGPTTAEQRADGFKVVYEGHECQWNGPSWPFATAQTLTALARTLHRFGEGGVTRADYLETLRIYSNSHRLVREDGKKVCWIDENINPFTGDWISRTMLHEIQGDDFYERGKDYNHSSFCDLIISGLIGIQPQLDGSVVIEPLVPEGEWDYFYLSGIQCAGKDIAVVYDRTGRRYHSGKGLTVYVNGRKFSHADTYSSSVTIPQ